MRIPFHCTFDLLLVRRFSKALQRGRFDHCLTEGHHRISDFDFYGEEAMNAGVSMNDVFYRSLNTCDGGRA